MKKTMAVIGATEPAGQVAVTQLASRPELRFLLLSPDTSTLESLTQVLQERFPAAEIESMACTRDASWEADIILLTIPGAEEENIARLIREVVTGKIVIHVSENGAPSAILPALLPHSIILNSTPDDVEEVLEHALLSRQKV